jgi:hypothetical protein
MQHTAPGQAAGSLHESSTRAAPHCPGAPQASGGVLLKRLKQHTWPSAQGPSSQATGTAAPLLDVALALLVLAPVALSLLVVALPPPPKPMLWPGASPQQARQAIPWTASAPSRIGGMRFITGISS